jgi:uncharacterized protein (DUF885 family)
MQPSEPFPHFVEDVLTYFYEALPSRASIDGVHVHDDLLEDVSRQGLDTHTRALGGFSRRLAQIDRDRLSEAEQIDHRILAGSLESQLFDFEHVRSWERSPHWYATVLSTALAGPTLLAYASDAERARRLVSRLRQVPRFTKSCEDNVKEPAGILVKSGLESWRGIRTFLERDLPRGFSRLDDLHILGDLADASQEAIAAVSACIDHFDREVAPKAKASFRLGTEVVEHSLKSVEGLKVSGDQLVRLGLKWLSELQAEFRQVAASIGEGEPFEVWRRVKSEHLLEKSPLDGVSDYLEELGSHLNKQSIVELPPLESPSLGMVPEFDRWRQAGTWASGPFEARLSRTRLTFAGADPAWADNRRREYLLDLNSSTRGTLVAREFHPGRASLVLALRQVESKVRKSTFCTSRTFEDGWAHYAEHALLESGFRRSDAATRLGQLAEELVGLARIVVAVRLHADDMSVEQGVRFFRDEAYLEESTARREAERCVFDYGHLLQAVGKRLLVRLRHDFNEQQTGKASMRLFHDAVLANGAVPLWAHRRLLLNDRTTVTLN